MYIKELLKDWPCSMHGALLEEEVSGITERAEKIRPGWLFVAKKGKYSDGADFIEEAVKRGASAIVADRHLLTSQANKVPIIIVPDCKLFLSYASARLAGNPSERLKIIAVTGTNGKTTVTHFVYQLLRHSGISAAVIGTIGVLLNDRRPEMTLPAMTTLPAEDLHPLLSYCEQQGITHIIMEASSIGLAEKRLAHCDIDIGVLLNIGQDHYEEHGGKEAYINSKKILLEQAAQLIINQEDEGCMNLAEQSRRVCTYFADNIVAGEHKPAGTYTFSIPGKHNESNMFAAVSIMQLLGINADEHVGNLQLPDGRLQCIEYEDIRIYIDYAHTPDAMEAVLQALAANCQGRLITVFGCGGDRDKGKRPEMGKLAVHYSQTVFITSDNPRSENPMEIIRDIQKGFGGDCSIVDVVADRKEAIRQAVFRAAPGDFVLIAGKGHEKTQQIAGQIIPFSDEETAKQALREKHGIPDE